MTSFVGYGISLNPMPLVDHQGNTIVARTLMIQHADEIGRFVVTRVGMGGNAHYAMSGAELKKLLPGPYLTPYV